MTRSRLLFAALAAGLLLAAPAFADSPQREVWVAARDLPRGAVLGEEDLRLARVEERRAPRDAAAAETEAVVGLQLRRSVREGRVLRERWLQEASAVERGQVVRLVLRSAGLQIVGKGRAVSDAGIGDRVRVLNLDSRREVIGRVARDGSVHVGL